MVAKPIRVLANGLELIELVSTEGPLAPGEIADRIGVPRPSVYRLIDGLNAIALTRTLPDGRVDLALRWLHLADSARSGMGEWVGARPILESLADRTGQTSYLTVPRGGEAVCIDWSPGRGMEVLMLRPGRALPFYAGAAGRAIVAFDEAAAAACLASAPFEAFTDRTLRTADDLRRDMERTRSAGYSVSEEDVTPGIGALGAPIRRSGVVIGCVSVGGLIDDVRAKREDSSAALLEARDALERSMQAALS